MDFTFSEDQEAIRSLAAKIVGDHSDPSRLVQIEESGEPFDRQLWGALGQAGLIGVGVGEPYGGGMGQAGVCLLLDQIGRHVTPLPAWTCACVVAPTLDRFGGAALKERLLPALVSGAVIGSAAMEEPLVFDALQPATVAARDGRSWRLEGEKVGVAYGSDAGLLLVSARQPDGAVGLFVVDAGADGLVVEPAVGTTGEPMAAIRLAGVTVPEGSRLGGPPGEAARFAHRAGLAGLAATAAGVLAGGLDITAAYIGRREQFGRPIATFQGAAMRIAGAYIDAQAVWLTAWSAIWKLDAGRPADEALAIAKFWVADGGQRAVHAFQHLHGGIGLDVSYPIHRYFTWAKSLEVTLGSASVQLDRLGRYLAEVP